MEPSRDLEDERFQAALADAIANLPERERLVLAVLRRRAEPQGNR
jgi:RNA polymerase sigma factor for flagellar operon FliA